MELPGRRLLRAAEIAGRTYTRTSGNQRAAAISYHVLFSLVPFVALLVSVLELVLPGSTHERVVAWLVGVIPLPEAIGESVEGAVAQAEPPASMAGLVALVGLIWAASGMMTSVRSAFRAVWGSEADRPYLRGKGLDVVLVLGAGILIVSAFGLSIAVQLVTETSTKIVTDLGSDGSRVGSLAQLVTATAVVLAAFLVLYRFVPPVAVGVRDVLPAALLATVGVEVASAGFSIYVERFADFDQVYGPLGTLLAFLLLVYIAAAILIVGACVAAAWPLSAAAELPGAAGPPVPLKTQVWRALRGLVLRS